MNMADSYCALFSASCRHSRRNCSMAAMYSSDRVSGGRVSYRGCSVSGGGSQAPIGLEHGVVLVVGVVEAGACLG